MRCWNSASRTEATRGHPLLPRPDAGLPHIYGHGITEADVERILRRPGEDGPSSGDSRQAIGQAERGRYLRMIDVSDEAGDSVFVVTADPLAGRELKAFRRRKRKRRRGK